jgi:alcohol dehydrogenase
MSRVTASEHREGKGMRAAIFNGPSKIVVEDRDKPAVVERTDAVVRVVMACVCGSDLWWYRGISDLPHGSIGHEFIGVVDEVGAEVAQLSVGDFVIAPFTWSDGVCKNCEAGFQTACVHGGLFGQGGEGDGGQAEFVRVPQADGTLVKVPVTSSPRR